MLGNILDAARRMCKRASGDDLRRRRRTERKVYVFSTLLLYGAPSTGKVEGIRARDRSLIRWTDQIKAATNHPMQEGTRKSAAREKWRRITESPVEIPHNDHDRSVKSVATNIIFIVSSQYHFNAEHRPLQWSPLSYVYIRIWYNATLDRRTHGCPTLKNLIKVKPKTTVVASELLVRFPLCKLASVATGETKQELLTLLGYADDAGLSNCYSRLKESVKTMAEGDLTLVNRIFVNYTDDIDPKFMLNSTEKFGVQVEKVGFNYPKAAVSFINNMVSAITFKRVADIVDGNDINKNTKMIIVGGAHFKGTWEFPFDYRLTKLTKFYHIDGRISRIPMMTKIDSFSNIIAGDCQALTIKFGSWRASITFVLPNTPQELPKLLEKIQDQKIYVNSLVKNMKMTPVKVVIPRFKIRTFVDWSGFLQELGLYSIFNTNSSDLSGILKKESQNKSENIAVSKIKQKVFVQIDELGVARFKLHPLRDLSPPKMPIFADVPKFTADRPFYFEITWDFEHGRYEMFTGVFYGPELGAVNT